MHALGAGDQDGLAELVRRHQQPLVGYLNGIVHDVERARDLCQEAFLRVYRHAEGYRPSSRFTTWLYHIARNLARDELRARRRRPPLAFPEHGLDATPAQERPVSGALEQRELVLAALDALSPRDRQLVVLRDLEGLSYEEIAERVGSRLGTVKSGLNRARTRFAAAYAALG
ncbi:MAG: sigma-70 family RNA polymerase sigma factor [Planctomycetota bacterium]